MTKIEKERNTTYYIDEEKQTIVCSIATQEYGDVKAKAVCGDNDTFDVERGKEIARLHATEKLKTLMLEEEFDTAMWLLSLTEDSVERTTNLQEELNKLRKKRAELSGVEYDEKTEGAETERLRYEYGRMTEKEEKKYEEKVAKEKAAKKARIAAYYEAKEQEKKKGEDFKSKIKGNTLSSVVKSANVSKIARDEHGRFAPKKEDVKRACRSILIEMD